MITQNMITVNKQNTNVSASKKEGLYNNIKSRPYNSSSTIHLDGTVKPVERLGDWIKVSNGKEDGYVNAKGTKDVSVKSDTDLKDSKGDKLTSVNKGDKVSVISVGSNKSKVSIGKHIGYIDNKHIGESNNDQGIIRVHNKLSNTVVSHTNKLPNISKVNISKSTVDNGNGSKTITTNNGNGVTSKSVINGSDNTGTSKSLIKVGSKNANLPIKVNTTNKEDNKQQIKDNQSKQNNSVTNQSGTTYYISNLNNGMSLNIRQQPSTSSQIIGSLNNGDSVTVVGKVGGWYKINYGNQITYVYGEFVSPTQSSQNTNSVVSNSSHNNSIKEGSYSVTSGGEIYSPTNSSFNMQNFRNYINSENAHNYTNSYNGMLSPVNSTKWAFVQVNHFRPVNVQKMNEILSNAGVLRGQGQAIVNAAKKWNLDPVYLMAQTILETGWGHSELAEGATINKIADFNSPIYNGSGNLVGYRMISVPPTTVYNLYGIGAYDNAPYLGGTSYAYTHGWTSVASALDGAAQFISENYVNNPTYQQNTPYKLRYPVNSKYSWHAYATAPNYGSQIGELMDEFRGCYLANDNITYSFPRG